MTDKDLRRLKRVDLLELLIVQTQENDRLKEELAEARALLEERDLIFKESGSIAEAALRINHVFHTTQAAADQYLLSVRKLGMRQQQRLKKMERDAQARAQAIIAQAEEKCRELEAEAIRRRDAILAQLPAEEPDPPDPAGAGKAPSVSPPSGDGTCRRWSRRQ